MEGNGNEAAAIDRGFIRRNRQNVAFRREATLQLVGENWKHFRHEERDRAMLIGFYTAVAVIVVSLKQAVPSINTIYLLLVLGTLSLVVAGLTWRIRTNLKEIDTRLDELARFVPLSVMQQVEHHLRTPSGNARILGRQFRWSTWIP